MTTTNATTLTEKLRNHVGKRAASLQARYKNNDSSAVADLAILRRGVAQRPGSDIRLIDLTIAGLYDNTGGLPDAPTPAEEAAYAALTLFAVHQQSHRASSMHRVGYSFGRSCRLLGDRSNAREAVRARFTAVATATSWQETLHHARGLIAQFRAFDIPLDYGQFAVDLLALQNPAYAERTRLHWGRDFYRSEASGDSSLTGTDITDSSDL